MISIKAAGLFSVSEVALAAVKSGSKVQRRELCALWVTRNWGHDLIENAILYCEKASKKNYGGKTAFENSRPWLSGKTVNEMHLREACFQYAKTKVREYVSKCRKGSCENVFFDGQFFFLKEEGKVPEVACS